VATDRTKEDAPCYEKDEFQVPLHDAYHLIDETRKQLDGLSKRFRFVMSHLTGKIEILGWGDGGIYAKYHQTNRASLHNKIFHRRLGKDIGWLDADGFGVRRQSGAV